jgi:hypothetical protein
MIFSTEMLSLYELLNSPGKEEMRKMLDKKEKYKLCLEIAKIFFTFHQFNPPICHGHLKSHNIFLEITN